MEHKGEPEELDVFSVKINVASGLSSADAKTGIVDTAVASSVSGDKWHLQYLDRAQAAGLGSMIRKDTVKDTVSENFKFGDGHLKKAMRRVTTPAVVANTLMLLKWYVIEDNNLPLLLGQDFALEHAIVVDISRRRLANEERFVEFRTSHGGHFAHPGPRAVCGAHAGAQQPAERLAQKDPQHVPRRSHYLDGDHLRRLRAQRDLCRLHRPRRPCRASSIKTQVCARSSSLPLRTTRDLKNLHKLLDASVPLVRLGTRRPICRLRRPLV